MKKIITTIVACAVLFTGMPAASAATVAPVNTAVTAQVPATSVALTQAKRSARLYLEYTSFSKKGLISQLRYEGFSKKVSKRAVNSMRMSWKKQAKRSARLYLEYTSFSGKGLYEQLRFEGFTKKQSRIGVRSVGLNP